MTQIKVKFKYNNTQVTERSFLDKLINIIKEKTKSLRKLFSSNGFSGALGKFIHSTSLDVFNRDITENIRSRYWQNNWQLQEGGKNSGKPIKKIGRTSAGSGYDSPWSNTGISLWEALSHPSFTFKVSDGTSISQNSVSAIYELDLSILDKFSEDRSQGSDWAKQYAYWRTQEFGTTKNLWGNAPPFEGKHFIFDESNNIRNEDKSTTNKVVERIKRQLGSLLRSEKRKR